MELRSILRWLLWPLMSIVCSANGEMEVLHSWRMVDFVFPSAATREAMLRTGNFIPENIALIDVDVWGGYGQGRKIFVTMPRFKPGTPATLATVGLSNLLTPYPDWSWHREGDCQGITSVFRVQVDACGRLWVLDSGTTNIFTKDIKMICPPQIVVFDLNADKIIGRYRFPEHVIDKDSLLTTIVVDTRDFKCADTFAYIADVVSYKLIVFDPARRRSWRMSSNYFYPYPLHGNFDINGAKFDLMDGILGLALGPINGGDRRLYFHSLASVKESWVSTAVLRNESLFLHGNGAPDAFKVSQFSRPSQSAAEAMTPNGVLFFGLLTNNSIACWNSKLPYTPDNIVTVAKNDDTLQFASGVKISNGLLWVLSSRLQNYIVNKVPRNETNYRVLFAGTNVLAAGTSCDDSYSKYGSNAVFSFRFSDSRAKPRQQNPYRPYI